MHPYFQIDQIKPSSISIAFVFLLLITSACNLSVTQQGSGSDPSDDLVDVFIEPNGTKPLVFLGRGGTQICRRGFPDESIYGLAPDETKEQTEQNEGEEDNQNTQTTQSTQSTSQSITMDVNENWFKMGLLIVNKSKTYYLVIEQLQFYVSAPWGNELLSSTHSIPSGYCGSDPLYIVPPTRKDARPNSYSGDRYLPLKKNYINNLTLFVHGIDIPEAPPVQAREDTAGGSDSQNNDNAQTNTQQSTIPRAPEPFVITYLPPYKVRLILNGHWIDKNRQHVANFRKTINFSLSSQFLN